MHNCGKRCFPAFKLNTDVCGVNLCVQSKCGEIRTRKTPNTDTFHAVLNIKIKYSIPTPFETFHWEKYARKWILADPYCPLQERNPEFCLTGIYGSAQPVFSHIWRSVYAVWSSHQATFSKGFERTIRCKWKFSEILSPKFVYNMILI